jgi:glycosyltransferase involved in cell wall biosynthesis
MLYLPGLEVTSGSLRSLAGYIVRSAVAICRLRALVKSERIDCVHVHYPTSSVILLGLIKALTGVHLVATFHGSDLVGIRNLPKLARRLTIRVLQGADRLVSVSDFIRQEAEALVVAPGRHCTVHNGTSAQAPDPLPAGELSQLSLVGRDYFVFIGTPRALKGADVMLQAWAILLRSAPSARLIVIGSDWNGCELLDRFPEFRSCESVSLLGWLEHSRVLGLIANALAVVVPSRREGFPYVLLEAGVCRTPAIATSVGGMPEVISHEQTGLLVESENADQLAAAMLRLHGDRKFAADVGQRLHERVMKEFTQSAMVAAYCAVYRLVLDADAV